MSFSSDTTTAKKSILKTTRNEHGEEEVTVLGHTGVLVNREEIEQFQGPIHIDEYPISENPNWIIRTKPNEISHESVREVSVRYLQPPELEHGEIIIQEEDPVIPPEAPPVVIRTAMTSAAPQSSTEQLIIREAPPKLPERIERRVIRVPGPILAPPPRKVIVQKSASLTPEQAHHQSVLIERWLAPRVPPVRVIYKRARMPSVRDYADVQNEIHECDAPRLDTDVRIIELGVEQMDPNQYYALYGNQLYETPNLPEIARNVVAPPGFQLASEVSPNYWIPSLEGDVDKLASIDLQAEGLGEYINVLRHGINKNISENQ